MLIMPAFNGRADSKKRVAHPAGMHEPGGMHVGCLRWISAAAFQPDPRNRNFCFRVRAGDAILKSTGTAPCRICEIFTFYNGTAHVAAGKPCFDFRHSPYIVYCRFEQNRTSDITTPSSRRDHRKSKFGLRQVIRLIGL